MKEINLIEPVYTEHLFRQVLLVLPLPVYTEHLFRQVLPVYTEHLKYCWKWR